MDLPALPDAVRAVFGGEGAVHAPEKLGLHIVIHLPEEKVYGQILTRGRLPGQKQRRKEQKQDADVGHKFSFGQFHGIPSPL